MSRPAPPDADLVGAYWARVADDLGLEGLDAPDAWAFGGTADQADELLGLVLTGTKTATSSALWSDEADDEPLPEVGDLSIVCDGRGRPRAVLRVTDVTVTDLDGVSAGHAFAEGEGDRTLAYWRRAHEDFFRRHLPAGRAARRKHARRPGVLRTARPVGRCERGTDGPPRKRRPRTEPPGGVATRSGRA